MGKASEPCGHLWGGFTQMPGLPPALEGIPVGHQLLQALPVLEDGGQLLLGRAGAGRHERAGGGDQSLGRLWAGGCHLTQPAERLEDIPLQGHLKLGQDASQLVLDGTAHLQGLPVGTAARAWARVPEPLSPIQEDPMGLFLPGTSCPPTPLSPAAFRPTPSQAWTLPSAQTLPLPSHPSTVAARPAPDPPPSPDPSAASPCSPHAGIGVQLLEALGHRGGQSHERKLLLQEGAGRGECECLSCLRATLHPSVCLWGAGPPPPGRQ